MIVSLADMKEHLRLETTDEDGLLTDLLQEVTAAAEDYCRVDFDIESAPLPVRLAVKLKVAFFYENRDIPDRQAYLATDTAFRALLYPHRDLEKMF